MLEIDLLPPEARDLLAAASGQHPQAHDVERLAVDPVLLQLAQGFAEAPYFFECEKSLLVIVGFLDRCRLARVAGDDLSAPRETEYGGQVAKHLEIGRASWRERVCQ